MLRARSFIRQTVVILAVAAVFFGPAQAAKKKDPGDTAPVLVSTKGAAPKWKNLAELQQFAAKGDPQACLELGTRYMEGDGVPQDTARAIPLFEQAAKGGVANAWFKLGKIYHDGVGVTTDYGQAMDYFILAARANVTEAQHNIGAMLVSARGVKRDYIEGLAWLIVATKSGDVSEAEAQVRDHLAKRQGDIAAAEMRADELLKDLPNAMVRAVFTGASARPAVVTPPKPDVAAPAVPPVDKPVIPPPKIDPLPTPKIVVPAPDKP